MEIKRIISDICSLDASIENHISNISKFKEEIIVEIKSKVGELNALENTISVKEKARFEL